MIKGNNKTDFTRKTYSGPSLLPSLTHKITHLIRRLASLCAKPLRLLGIWVKTITSRSAEISLMFVNIEWIVTQGSHWSLKSLLMHWIYVDLVKTPHFCLNFFWRRDLGPNKWSCINQRNVKLNSESKSSFSIHNQKWSSSRPCLLGSSN